MTQKISVRIRVVHGDKTLLVRRADGRESLIGQYELPGGRVLENEQPDDAARRFLGDQVGMDEVPVRLNDVMTYQDKDDSTVQYAVIIYLASIGKTKRAVQLNQHYDKYIWYLPGKIDPTSITEVSQLALGAISSVPFGEISDKSADGNSVFIYTDGGSRGNPGPSASGFVIIKDGKIIEQGGEYIGITTNNSAEYYGVKLGLESAIKLGITEAEVRLDSMLVVNQINGVYNIKNRELWPINERVNELIGQFKRIKFTYIPRELNQLADGMVNRTLNRQEKHDTIG